MITTYQIPLSGFAETFTVNLAGTTYTFTVKWNNAPDAGWILDIADSNQNPIVCGMPLITGDNILDGLNYLNFGGALIVRTDGDLTAVPTFDNLGTECNLYFEVTTL